MVSVIGLGFVGLTTALGLAEYGHAVYGIDLNEDRFNWIISGVVPFEEPGMGAALNRHLNNKFFPTNNLKKAISESKIIFICVGTPCDDEGKADISQIISAIDSILAELEDEFKLIVIKSSVPPRTTIDSIVPYIEGLGYIVNEDIGIAVNPEFLREGHCWDDFIYADRIVIGVEDKRSEAMLKELYSPAKTPIIKVNINTAEFIKYLSNSSLATLISFANEMSLVADALGDIDVSDAFRVVHQDKRWQDGSIRSYFYPGCGYGGYCLPKDTVALYSAAKESGYTANMLENAIKLNDEMPQKTVDKIVKATGNDKDMCIGILGLAFNAGSDDVRNSVSSKVIRLLNEAGYENIIAYDPIAIDNFRKTFELMVEFAVSEEQLLESADVVAILTRWPQFKGLRERTDIRIIDCVNML